MAASLAELFITVGADVSAAIAGLTLLETRLQGTKTAFEAAAPAAELLVAAGVGIAVGLGAAVNTAAEFDSKLTAVRNNTTMTDADMAAMRATVLRLGAEGPTALDNLAEGFMHASNFGFNAADSAVVLEAAWKSAVSTGGNVAATTDVLAAVLHEFGLNASQAAATMDILHTASAEGNLTLEQFSASFGQVAAWAAAVGVPLDEVAAAMSTMTRHGFDAATAATQVKDQIAHLINPSQGAKKALAELAVESGVNLTNAMSSTNLHARGLVGVMDQITGAMDKAGLTADQQTSLWLKLIPNIRGGAAAFVLAGRGAEDLKQILADEENSLGTTDAAFARIQKTLGFEWGTMTNLFKEMAIVVVDFLAPSVGDVVNHISDLVNQFLALPASTQETITKFAAIAGVVATLLGSFVLLAPFIGAVGPAFLALGGALVALTPVFLGLAAVAAVLFATWQVNLFGIQDMVASAFDRLPDILATVTNAFSAAARFWTDAVLPAVRNIGDAVGDRLGPIFDRVGPILGNLGLVFQKVFAGDITGAVDTFQAIIGAIAPGVGRLVVNIRSAVGGFFDTFGPILGNFGLVAQKVLEGDLGGAFDTLRAIVGSFGTFFGQVVVGDLGGAFATLRTTAGAMSEPFGNLLGIFQNIGGFIATQVVPGMADLADRIMPALTGVAATLGEIWDTKLSPPLLAVGGIVRDIVVSNFQKLLESLPTLQTASETLATFWDTKMQPAFQKVGDFIDANLLKSLADLGTGLAGLTGEKVTAVGDVFGGALLQSLSNFGSQLQPLVPVFQSVGSFFASVGDVFAAFAELRSRSAAGGVAEDPLTSSLQRLVDFVTANADLGDHMLLLFGPMGQALAGVVNQGKSTAEFFLNMAEALHRFAEALRSLPELPDWIQKALGANSLQGAAAGAGGQIGTNIGSGIASTFAPAAAGAGGGTVHFNAPININTPVQLQEFYNGIAAAISGAASRVSTPPDNSGFPALNVAP